MTAGDNAKCSICNSAGIRIIDYLNYKGNGFFRNMAYALPVPIANFLSKISHTFARLYYPVRVNKKYFSRKIGYCSVCHSGCVTPEFTEEELDEYYGEFYWKNRGHHEDIHDISSIHIPLAYNINLSRERIGWIQQNGVSMSPQSFVIDFGAGDCAAAYTFKTDFGIANVSIVDKSTRSKDIAKKLGVNFYSLLKDIPSSADILFSAHSIEHVHDLKNSLYQIFNKIKDGGYIFFETPNIADLEIFKSMAHTPHTYMLSTDSFVQLACTFSYEIVAVQTSGPRWKLSHPKMKSEGRTDLRVLLRKLGPPKI